MIRHPLAPFACLTAALAVTNLAAAAYYILSVGPAPRPVVAASPTEPVAPITTAVTPTVPTTQTIVETTAERPPTFAARPVPPTTEARPTPAQHDLSGDIIIVVAVTRELADGPLPAVRAELLRLRESLPGRLLGGEVYAVRPGLPPAPLRADDGPAFARSDLAGAMKSSAAALAALGERVKTGRVRRFVVWGGTFSPVAADFPGGPPAFAEGTLAYWLNSPGRSPVLDETFGRRNLTQPEQVAGLAGLIEDAVSE